MNRELGWSGRTGHGTCNNLFSFNNNRSQNSASLLYDQAVQTPRHFIRRAMSSMSLARRMKLAQNLNYHEGCVNALNFNRIGTLLASGSDDYQVCLWDWTRNNLVLTFDSGHKSNVFQVSVFFCCNWVHFWFHVAKKNNFFMTNLSQLTFFLILISILICVVNR